MLGCLSSLSVPIEVYIPQAYMTAKVHAGMHESAILRVNCTRNVQCVERACQTHAVLPAGETVSDGTLKV